MAKSLRDRAIGILGGVLEDDLNAAAARVDAAEARAARAYESGFQDGNDEPASGDLKTFGYRRATAGSVRDFGGLDYEQVMDTAWRVFLMSPVARRYIQLKRDYELGRGLEPHSDDKPTQEVITDFWEQNKLDSRLKEFTSQIHLLGEQVYPAFVRATDGRVSLGYIDPSEIHKIIQHPDNVLERWAVVLKPPQADHNEPWRPIDGKHRVYRIIREAEPVANGWGEVELQDHAGMLVTHEQTKLEKWEPDMLEAFGLKEKGYTGSCFYFHRNALSNQPRGYTDFLQVVDFIDQDEGVLFDLADRENIASYFLVDVTANGLTEDKIEQKASELRAKPPKKGSINVHNDQETWTMNAPDLKQVGSVETYKAILEHVLGGQGIPKHWYGSGDETNRATAQAQGGPTWRTMETDQDSIRDMILMMLYFARDQASIAGRGIKPEAEITLVMPEMTVRDIATASAAMSQVSLALAQAVDAGWMTNATAAEAWAKVISEIGVEIDPEEELKKIAADGESKVLGQQAGRNDWYVQHGIVTDGEQAIPVEIGQGETE